MMISKRKLSILIGLLFVVGLSADPIIHSWEEAEHQEIHQSIDCTVCESESFEAYDLSLVEEYVLISKNLISSDNDLRESLSTNFNSRAPPIS